MTKDRANTSVAAALAAVCLVALLPASGAAQDDPALPRVIKLPEATGAVLPGDSSGTRFGVAVRRGPGFPPQVAAVEAPDEPDQPEVTEIEPVVQSVTRPASIGGY